MTMRSSKRLRQDVEPETSRTPPAKKKGKKVRAPAEPTGEQQSEEQDPVEQQPSGFPFIDAEVNWKYERINLLPKPHKVVPAGYESMAGDVNAILKTLPIPKADLVRNSAKGEFTRLDDFTIRSGKMLHFMVCHQVTPELAFDPTSLFFRIGDTTLRFSRVEYALVSGLKFGPSNFNPYITHQLSSNSIFERLFGADDKTTLHDVRLAYINKNFEKAMYAPTTDDYVKLSKFLLALNFALGFDATKKKIPLWLWVLIEDDDEWEEFPWGSISYQILVHVVKGVKKLCKGKKLNYTLKGNTMAFSAWVFESVPAFSKDIGNRKTERQIPRFMRYSYVKEKTYPTDAEINERFLQLLKPHKKERDGEFFKSLKSDPAEEPFAFQYDPTESKKKRPRDDDEEEEEDDPAENAHVLADDQLTRVAAAAANKVMVQMKTLIETYNDTNKKLIAEYHKKLVGEVAEKVTKTLLERAPDYMEPVDENQGQLG